MLLKELSNLPGVSGNEDLVREYILNQIKPYCDNYKVDKNGNIISVIKASESTTNIVKVMLCAHMDEVGLIVNGVDRNGNIKFMTVGGIDPKVLPGSRVLIGNNDIKGIVGIKAVHLQNENEFKKVITTDQLRIDIGSDNKKQTEKLIELGDYIIFDTVFEEFGEGLYSGKAFDDRVGCAILIEVMRNMKRPDFDLYICFSVKEEIGLVGAKLLANEINPHIAIVVEGTTCADIPEVESHMTSSVLKGGPVLTHADGASISSRRLNKLIEQTAKENHIKYQYKNTVTGGNDTGALQRNAGGAEVASVSVPCRYIHSPVSVISREDYDNTFYLVTNIIKKLSETGGVLNV